MLRRTTLRRRGNCLFQTLLALAVISVLVTVAGVVGLLQGGFGDVAQAVQNGPTMEAPGKATLTLPKGAAMIFLQPEGKVGDKLLGRPPESVTYTFVVTDPAGIPVRVEANGAPRDPSAPFEILAVFNADSPGDYTIEAIASDGSTPAAIMITAMDMDMMKNLGIGSAGGCLAVCGCLATLGFGIPAFFVRRSARKAQQANDA